MPIPAWPRWERWQFRAFGQTYPRLCGRPYNAGMEEEIEQLEDYTGSEELADDALRRLAAEKLARHLEMGGELVARCQELAKAGRGDRLGPLTAAARLMRANAQVAQTLAHVALVERRSRTIVETIQKPDPKISELNAKEKSRREEAELLLKWWRRMSEHAEETIKARTGQKEGRDFFLERIHDLEKELARIKREEGDYD